LVVFAPEWAVTAKQFVKNHAEAVNVRTTVDVAMRSLRATARRSTWFGLASWISRAASKKRSSIIDGVSICVGSY
jgi:hypothetical protein